MKQKKNVYKEDRLFHLLTYAGWALLGFFLCFLAVVIFRLAQMRRFRNDYAASTAYAQQNAGMTASLDGGAPQRLAYDAPGTLYNLLVNQQLRAERFPDEAAHELELLPGDGSALTLCLTADEQLYLRFCTAGGRSTSYLVQMTGASRYWFGLMQALGLQTA